MSICPPFQSVIPGAESLMQTVRMPLLQIGTKQEQIDGQGQTELIEVVLAKGISSFQLAYSFADDYLTFYPEVLNILQNRFRFVFVDEAQDLNSIQLDIIDKIFNAGKSSTKVQRIGDKNQSIYGSGAKVKSSL